MKRPLGITILAVIAFFTAVGNGLRLGEAVFFWMTLAEYGAHPLYLAISGSTWLIAGLFLVWGIWQRKAWGWVAALGGTVGYTAWYWFDRLVLQKPHANWPFLLIVNILLFFSILIILFLHTTRLYFQEDTNERKPKTSTPA